ncbi:MAG: WecB/TagA/CpsF family glycosyltransferase [Alkalispirochaetaceae bacterium]
MGVTGEGGRAIERARVIGIPIDNIRYEDLSEAVDYMTRRKTPSQIAFVRSWDVLRARHSREYREALEQCALVVPVAKGLVRSARFLGFGDVVRHLPFQFVVRLLSVLEEKGGSVFLLGSSPSRLSTVEQNIRETFPRVRVVGRHEGGFSEGAGKNILLAVRKADPSLLLTGRGIRRGDLWLYFVRRQLPGTIALWSGETFDIMCGRRRPASQRAFVKGREDLALLFRRPWRMLRFFGYLWFGALLIFYRLFKSGR